MKFRTFTTGSPLPLAILLWTVVFTATFMASVLLSPQFRALFPSVVFWRLLLLNLPWTSSLAIPMGLQVAVMCNNSLSDRLLLARLRSALAWGAATTILVFVVAAHVVPRTNSALATLSRELMGVTAPAQRAKNDRELTLGELHADIQRLGRAPGEGAYAAGRTRTRNTLRVEFYKKISIPLICLSSAFASAIIGGLLVAAGRYRVPLLVLINSMFFSLFWVLLVAGEKYADAGILPPVLAMMAPNIALAVVGAALLGRALRTSHPDQAPGEA